MANVDRVLVRDVGAVALASGVVGVSFGALAVAAGMSVWMALFMSVVVFAGGAQFVVVGMVAAGGSPAAAVVAGLLLNARHLPFGLAVADLLGKRWSTRLLGAHLMVDESVAFALSQREPGRRRAAYWLCGGMLFVGWNTGVVLGGWAGRVVGSSESLGLDAAFPACMVALLLPSLLPPREQDAEAGARERAAKARQVALVGALIALVLTPWLPMGLPVILSILAVGVALR
ncbi:AzlC family ABC transporter permease [Myxococcus sp. MISCRS1]|jgi:4-azaleucine resistance transporter AzlC|uniref:AzlC family ABC transporter permease n=1 Tax=Myxococcus TaxID=32 RepID=UPI001CC06FE0|nr:MULTISPECIES: AzlC family ABC transporter permease [unclassified Myxococcus]MBZ4395129.1 AzlC family ABC transporter permease [Myxococcus sp. AS-1-15]MBZ4406924.1 AzlC family ABC transporter permease [Myxococcus sp. XM-1-1-1]MCY1002115.1 AzlC family ABC transporter permease [Myxococcus sp. MISCRS1]BDT36312.1 AzlC family ABC transporter permease [Myxococcus sp. MH1]